MFSCHGATVIYIQNGRTDPLYLIKVSRAYDIGRKAGACSPSLYAGLEQQGFIISVTATLTMPTLRFRTQGNSVTNAISEPRTCRGVCMYRSKDNYVGFLVGISMMP